MVTLPAQEAVQQWPPWAALIILLLIICFGILGDFVGLATAVATEQSFHAMAAKQVSGARQAIWLVRHADSVASIGGDVIGDIAGTVSGAGATAIAVRIASASGFSLWNTLMIVLTAGITVGGKAAMKGIALQRGNDVVFTVGRLIAFVERMLHVRILPDLHRERGGERKSSSDSAHHDPAAAPDSKAMRRRHGNHSAGTRAEQGKPSATKR